MSQKGLFSKPLLAINSLLVLHQSNLARQNPTQRTSFLKKVAASARRVITPSKKSVITIQSENDNSLVLMEEDTPLTDNTQETILALVGIILIIDHD